MGKDGMGPMNGHQLNEPRPPRWQGRDTRDGTSRHMAEIFAADQARLNALVKRLDGNRPGKWRQKDAIRYLLDCYEEAAGEPLVPAGEAS